MNACACGSPKEPRARRCLACHLAWLASPRDDLFWAKVDRSGGPDQCWPWNGYTHRGYGVASRQGRNRRAHRIAYALLVGPAPHGLDIDHQCHNRDLSCPGGPTCQHRRCCNPAHLEPASRRVNTLRGRGPTARHARQATCRSGHALAGQNVRHYVYRGRPQRICRTCEHDRHAERAARLQGGRGATHDPEPVMPVRKAA